jgi:hypothetical protein
MIAAPVQCDVDGIPKGSHYVFLKRANVFARELRGGTSREGLDEKLLRASFTRLLDFTAW